MGFRLTDRQNKRVGLIIADLSAATTELQAADKEKQPPALARFGRTKQIAYLRAVKLALESALMNVKFLLAELELEAKSGTN